ncbi:MAG: ATP-binding protein [Bacteroidota bacterium]
MRVLRADLEVMINQKNAIIRKGNLPKLQGAQVLLYQLFYNLINNSLKFSKSDPEITISSSLIKDGEKDLAQIVVADNGIGFDQQFADRLFNAFMRLHSKDQYEGTGLDWRCARRSSRDITEQFQPGVRMERGASLVSGFHSFRATVRYDESNIKEISSR